MEEVTASFLSRMIQKTQERIENHFFEARKNVLEYDDVLNAQREHIYGLRREILLGKDIRTELKTYIRDLIVEVANNAWMIEEDGTRVYDHGVLFEDLNEVFPLVDYATIDDLQKIEPGTKLVEYLQDIANQAYDAKIVETGEPMKLLEQHVLLRAVNDAWMEHLQTIEYIREGIGLRGYGQTDPLVAYKKETFNTFQTTLKNIRDQASKMIFHMRLQQQQQVQQEDREQDFAPLMFNMDDLPPELQEQHGMQTQGAATAIAPVALGNIDWKRVGRNDPCPCGSGKKFKSCHYPILRAEGAI